MAAAAAGVAALRRAGQMTMLALDQRGSLRTMLAAGRPESEVTDARLHTFKEQAVAALAPCASAVLLDWPHGRDAMAALPPDTPLILAADQLRQRPGYLPGRLEHVEEFSCRMTERITQPWVVLSSGVQAEDVAGAVRRAVAGGASGFLAGRAIWADAARSGNPAEALGSVSVPRPRALADIARQAGRSRPAL